MSFAESMRELEQCEIDEVSGCGYTVDVGGMIGFAVGLAAGTAIADFGVVGGVVSGLAGWAASEMPVDPNQAFPISSIPNKE